MPGQYLKFVLRLIKTADTFRKVQHLTCSVTWHGSRRKRMRNSHGSVWKEIATFARKLARDHRALIASDPNYRKRARQVLTALYSHPSRGAGEDREAGCTAMLNSTAMEADRDNSARSKIPPVEGDDHIVREPALCKQWISVSPSFFASVYCRLPSQDATKPGPHTSIVLFVYAINTHAIDMSFS